MTAPICPISSNQPKTLWQPPGVSINSIPHANNLQTVIDAIHKITNVVTQITRGTPQVNNVHPPVQAPPTMPPAPVDWFNYARINWIEESRDYTQSQVVNPNNPDQKVPIKTLSTVSFYDTGTGNTLVYYTQG